MEKIIGDLSIEEMSKMLARMEACRPNEMNSSTNGVYTEEIAKLVIDIRTSGTRPGELRESNMKLNSESLNLISGVNMGEDVDVFQTDLVRTDDRIVLTDSNISPAAMDTNTNLVHTDTDIVQTDVKKVQMNNKLIHADSNLVSMNSNLVPTNTNLVPTTTKESSEDTAFYDNIDNQLLSNLLGAMQFLPSSVSGPGPRFPSVLIQQYKEVIYIHS